MSKNVKVKVIYTFSDGILQNSSVSTGLKVSFEQFPISCNIAVFEDKVRIASLKDRLIGIVIEDKEIAQSMKAFFLI